MEGLELASAQRLDRDPGLELGAMGAAVCSWVGAPSQGPCLASLLNDGDCPENPDHLKHDVA